MSSPFIVRLSFFLSKKKYQNFIKNTFKTKQIFLSKTSSNWGTCGTPPRGKGAGGKGWNRALWQAACWPAGEGGRLLLPPLEKAVATQRAQALEPDWPLAAVSVFRGEKPPPGCRNRTGMERVAACASSSCFWWWPVGGMTSSFK